MLLSLLRLFVCWLRLFNLLALLLDHLLLWCSDLLNRLIHDLYVFMFNVRLMTFLDLLQTLIYLWLCFFVNFNDLFVADRVDVFRNIRQNKQNLLFDLGNVISFLIFRLLRNVFLFF